MMRLEDPLRLLIAGALQQLGGVGQIGESKVTGAVVMGYVSPGT